MEEKGKEWEEKMEKKAEAWGEKKEKKFGDECKPGKKKKMDNGMTGGAIYFVGFIGALVYYLGVADSFWTVILGILKACVWPAFLVHSLLQYLG